MSAPAKKRNEVAGKKISIIGAARSGVAVAQLLKSRGADVFVSDNSNAEKISTRTSVLESQGILFETGRHSERVYDAELVVLSPGVPSTSPAVLEARRRNLRVISELEAASWFCPSPIVAITGSNGKTTTTTLIGRMLHDAKKKHIVAGNIGTAFSSIVQEVSSFQLDYIESFHPHISILLNITADHLDRYEGSMEKYAASKCRIFEHQTMDDYLIYNFDDQETTKRVQQLAGRHVTTLPFGFNRQFKQGAFVENRKLVTVIDGEPSTVVDTDAISIRGTHNLYNSMAAALAGRLLDIRTASLRATLKNFKGVEHRLEFVREVKGVKYINDSKATNVDSVWYALQAYNEPIVLLLGGRDKGNDYSRLFEPVQNHVKSIVAIGESADKVHAAFIGKTKVVKAGNMNNAVNLAQASAVAGDIVLLSPACASFDWFENYEQRGKVFKELVNAL
jgi:UDP-N-acetylmuramoylalanine--D-glutamate ligase